MTKVTILPVHWASLIIYLIYLLVKGLSEEEVRTAAACAGEEVMIRNQFMEMNAPKDSSYVNK